MVTSRVKFDSKGFTLVELLAVLAIIAIVAAIAVPSYLSYISKAEKEVCHTNLDEIGRVYKGYLNLEGIEHSELVFTKYIHELWEKDVCPSGGNISYRDGDVNCNIHAGEHDDHEDDNVGGVPYL